ncbi:hypothetical protein PFMC_00784 [Plasmodium falciparum CAMP/Malaysia]|uniref:Armadillo-domain containing rhoptry protein n=1 Tax=Plasmodium falciparum (isolate Camp / Malaysia) TaxID=5835 RepID=A0A024XDP0_PLAFC|nr:hypothetical protein PFMC_00784 [Plasmodium falciparum CAMP/Malaysia]
MGNNCCAGRDLLYKNKLQEFGIEGSKTIRKLLSFTSNDILRFDKAYDENDVQEFVNLCSSTCEELDRVHAAVVALSFLSVDNVKNCICMFESGALPYLISGMKSNIDGMKAACAQTCRNIFVLDKKYKKEFLKLGGITQLVNLLELPSNYDDSQPLYTQLEAIYHLEDFILNDGDEIPEFLEAVKNSNSIKNLKTLQQCPEQDLAEASNVLLLRLTD